MQRLDSSDRVTLRVHHFLLSTAPVHFRVLMPWAERVMRSSGGWLDIEVYPAMQLGGQPVDLCNQARDGFVDIVWAMPSYDPGRFPLVEVFELPFMMTARAATSRAANEYVVRHCGQEFGEVHVLSAFVIGPGAFFMRTKSINTLADLAGQRLRAPTPRTARLAALLGAIPVETSPAAVRNDLEQGVLDGAMINWDFAGGTRSYEVAKFNSETHESLPGLYTSVIVLAMNKKRYQEMPDDLRAVLDQHSGDELARWIGQVMNGAEEGWRAKALASGNHLNIIPVEELNRWRELVGPVREEWVREITERGHNGRALLNAAVDLIERYSEA